MLPMRLSDYRAVDRISSKQYTILLFAKKDNSVSIECKNFTNGRIMINRHLWYLQKYKSWTICLRYMYSRLITVNILSIWIPWRFHTLDFICIFWLFVCLLVWRFSSHSRIFHSFGDATIAGERMQILTCSRHLWPLSSEVSLACHTYCDTGHPFILKLFISEDSWHSHRLPSF